MAMFSQRRTVPALFKDDFLKFPFFFTSFIKAKDCNDKVTIYLTI